MGNERVQDISTKVSPLQKKYAPRFEYYMALYSYFIERNEPEYLYNLYLLIVENILEFPDLQKIYIEKYIQANKARVFHILGSDPLHNTEILTSEIYNVMRGKEASGPMNGEIFAKVCCIAGEMTGKVYISHGGELMVDPPNNQDAFILSLSRECDRLMESINKLKRLTMTFPPGILKIQKLEIEWKLLQDKEMVEFHKLVQNMKQYLKQHRPTQSPREIITMVGLFHKRLTSFYASRDATMKAVKEEVIRQKKTMISHPSPSPVITPKKTSQTTASIDHYFENIKCRLDIIADFRNKNQKNQEKYLAELTGIKIKMERKYKDGENKEYTPLLTRITSLEGQITDQLEAHKKEEKQNPEKATKQGEGRAPEEIPYRISETSGAVIEILKNFIHTINGTSSTIQKYTTKSYADGTSNKRILIPILHACINGLEKGLLKSGEFSLAYGIQKYLESIPGKNAHAKANAHLRDFSKTCRAGNFIDVFPSVQDLVQAIISGKGKNRKSGGAPCQILSHRVGEYFEKNGLWETCSIRQYQNALKAEQETSTP